MVLQHTLKKYIRMHNRIYNTQYKAFFGIQGVNRDDTFQFRCNFII